MATDTQWRRRGMPPYRPIPELEEMRRRFEDDIVRPLMRNSPFRPSPELDDMRRKFERDFVRPVVRSIYGRIPEEQKGWAPAIDIIEKGDNFIVKAELPGLKQEDIDVSVTEDMLTIKGERKPDSGVKDEEYVRSEMVYGSFYRSIMLPPGIDTKNIEAVYEDGIIRITLQRMAEAKAKKVTFKVKKGAS